MPVVEEIKPILAADTLLTADAGYHSEKNLKDLADKNIEALIVDNGMRKRDERFADQDKHKAKPDPLWDKSAPAKKEALFGPKDFTYDEEAKVCICPAGEFLYPNGSNVLIQGKPGVKFKGAKRVCGPCPLREQCLRNSAWCTTLRSLRTTDTRSNEGARSEAHVVELIEPINSTGTAKS